MITIFNHLYETHMAINVQQRIYADHYILLQIQKNGKFD